MFWGRSPSKAMFIKSRLIPSSFQSLWQRDSLWKLTWESSSGRLGYQRCSISPTMSTQDPSASMFLPKRKREEWWSRAKTTLSWWILWISITLKRPSNCPSYSRETMCPWLSSWRNSFLRRNSQATRLSNMRQHRTSRSNALTRKGIRWRWSFLLPGCR